MGRDGSEVERKAGRRKDPRLDVGRRAGWAEAKEVGQILGTDGMEKLEEMGRSIPLVPGG